MKLFLVALLTTVSMGAQSAWQENFSGDNFRAVAIPWTNHRFPALIAPYLPIAPGLAKEDGAMVTLEFTDPGKSRAVLVSITYVTQDGRTFRRHESAELYKDPSTGAIRAVLVSKMGEIRAITSLEVALVPGEDVEVKN